MHSRIAQRTRDASGRYEIVLEQFQLDGFPVSYRVHVTDTERGHALVLEETYHRDADAMSEGWAVIALLLAQNDSHLGGAYVIGASAY